MSKILFSTSEAHPLIKTGGLGDVSASLPPALAALGEEEAVYAPLIAGEGKVYVHTNLDTLHEVDVRTGAKRQLDINE